MAQRVLGRVLGQIAHKVHIEQVAEAPPAHCSSESQEGLRNRDAHCLSTVVTPLSACSLGRFDASQLWSHDSMCKHYRPRTIPQVLQQRTQDLTGDKSAS